LNYGRIFSHITDILRNTNKKIILFVINLPSIYIWGYRLNISI
jgi:hypothetical protein